MSKHQKTALVLGAGVFDCNEVERLLLRLEDHLQN